MSFTGSMLHGGPFFRLLRREHVWRPVPTVFARKSVVYPGCSGTSHGSTVNCTTERSASLRSELVEWLFSGIIGNGVVQELGVSFFGMVKNSFGAPVVFCILLPRRLILCFSPTGQTLLLGASGDVICGDSWPNVFMVVHSYLSQSVKLAEIYRIFPHHQN